MSESKRIFQLEVATMFENNEFANALFLNNLTDESGGDFAKSKNIRFNKELKAIELIDLLSEGEYLTDDILTDASFGEALDNFFIMAKEERPAGAKLSYFLILSDGRVLPIKPNHNVPLKIYGKKITSFKVMIKFKAGDNKSPRLHGLAVLYFDQMVMDNLGLINPNLRPTPEVEEDRTFLEFESLD